MKKSAEFSPDRKYRYTLERTWDESKGTVVFIGLNPSTADESVDDPTIRRCIGYAKDWGYGRLVMLNIFAFRATNPTDLYKEKEPVGLLNKFYITEEIRKADLVITAWGTHGKWLGRGLEVYHEICEAVPQHKINALGFTKEGYPRHPLYLRSDLEPVTWSDYRKIISESFPYIEVEK